MGGPSLTPIVKPPRLLKPAKPTGSNVAKIQAQLAALSIPSSTASTVSSSALPASPPTGAFFSPVFTHAFSDLDSYMLDLIQQADDQKMIDTSDSKTVIDLLYPIIEANVNADPTILRTYWSNFYPKKKSSKKNKIQRMIKDYLDQYTYVAPVATGPPVAPVAPAAKSGWSFKGLFGFGMPRQSEDKKKRMKLLAGALRSGNDNEEILREYMELSRPQQRRRMR